MAQEQQRTCPLLNIVTSTTSCPRGSKNVRVYRTALGREAASGLAAAFRRSFLAHMSTSGGAKKGLPRFHADCSVRAQAIRQLRG